jgi:hypothetical protein
MAWCRVGIEGVNRSPCGWNPLSGPRACTIYFEALCYLEKKLLASSVDSSQELKSDGYKM